MTTDEPLAAEALLAQEAATLEAKWAELSDEALLAEIQKYKDAVTNLSTKISSLGTLWTLKRKKSRFQYLLVRDHFQFKFKFLHSFRAFRRRCPFRRCKRS
jgi:hypothetical protein